MGKAAAVRHLARLLLPFLLLACGAWIGAGCSSPTPETEKTAPVVELASLEQREIYETIALSGQVSAHREVSVPVELPGRVAEVLVKMGEEVQAGDLLVRLEGKDQEVQLLQAEAALAAARAQLGEARAGARPQDLAQAEAGLRQAESGYETAARQRERMEALYAEGIVSLQELELARSQYANAAAALEAARAALQKLEAGPTPYTLQALEAQVAQAEAALLAARRQYEKTFICTPISGKVAAVLLRAGELAGAGTPAVVVVDDDPLYLDVFVDEKDVGLIRAGDEAQVEVPAAGAAPFPGAGKGGGGAGAGFFPGVVREVSPAALAGSRSFQVRVELPNKDGLIKHGMFARVVLRTRRWEGAFIVPATAVQQRDGRDYIFFYDDGYARAVEVTTGQQLEGMIQVFGDFPAMPVIVRAPRSLNDSDPVLARR